MSEKNKGLAKSWQGEQSNSYHNTQINKTKPKPKKILKIYIQNWRPSASIWSSYFLKNNSLVKPLTGRRGKNPHWLGSHVTPHFTLFIFFFPLSKQTECWSSENMMLSHFSCRVFKLGLWERVWYNSMTEVIPLSIWALNGPLKYSLVRKNFSKWCFLIFYYYYYYYSFPNRLQPGSENAVQSLLVAS